MLKKSRLRLMPEQASIIYFLALFLCSGVFLLVRNELLADKCAAISLGFLILPLFYNLFSLMLSIISELAGKSVVVLRWVYNLFSLMLSIILELAGKSVVVLRWVYNLFSLMLSIILELAGKSVVVLRWIYNFLRFPAHIIPKLPAKISALPFKRLVLLICIFYSIPLFLKFEQSRGWYLTLPKVYGGDEEHYLLMINSLIKDYDLELKNNYQNAKDGGYDAGSAWRGRILDHHSVYVNKKTKRMVHFWDIVDVGHTLDQWVIKRPNVYNDLDSYTERPHHPPGMPFVFSLILFPFAGWKYLECAAILLMVLMSILGLVFLYKILYATGEDKRGANMALFIIAAGTPVYYYSLLLFKEMFLGAILTAVCWLYFFRKEGLFSGVLVVLGCFTRYSFPVIAIPLILYGLVKREWKQLLTFLFVTALGAGGIFLYNYHMYGGILKFSQPWSFGKWLEPRYLLFIFGAVPLIILGIIYSARLIFSRKIVKRHFKIVRAVMQIAGAALLFLAEMHYPVVKEFFIGLKNGLIPFSPVLIFAIWMMLDVKIWEDGRISGILGVIFVYIAIYAVKGFGVGSAFSCRQIVPVVPLMAVPLYYWIKIHRGRFAVRVFGLLAVYSFIINLLAVSAQQYFWHLPLDQALVQLFKRWFCV